MQKTYHLSQFHLLKVQVVVYQALQAAQVAQVAVVH